MTIQEHISNLVSIANRCSIQDEIDCLYRLINEQIKRLSYYTQFKDSEQRLSDYQKELLVYFQELAFYLAYQDGEGVY